MSVDDELLDNLMCTAAWQFQAPTAVELRAATRQYTNITPILPEKEIYHLSASLTEVPRKNNRSRYTSCRLDKPSNTLLSAIGDDNVTTVRSFELDYTHYQHCSTVTPRHLQLRRMGGFSLRFNAAFTELEYIEFRHTADQTGVEADGGEGNDEALVDPLTDECNLISPPVVTAESMATEAIQLLLWATDGQGPTGVVLRQLVDIIGEALREYEVMIGPMIWAVIAVDKDSKIISRVKL